MNYTFPLSSGIKDTIVTLPFKQKYSSGRLSGKTHKGLDLAPPKAWGTPKVLATCLSECYKKGYDADGWGYYIVLKGFDNKYHIYAHMKSATLIELGQSVNAGDVLGIMGSTGNSSGDHLHYEIRTNYADKNTLLNPAEILGIVNQKGYVKVANDRIIQSSSGNTSGNKPTNSVPQMPSTVPYEELTPIVDTEKNGEILFGRKYRIIVSDGKEDGVDITNLHVKFQCVKTYLNDLQYSIIQIYNLNRDTEAFILRKGTMVTIEAGYEGTHFGEIFTGDIIQSMGYQENGTDFVLKIVAADSDRFMTEGFVNYNIPKGATQREIADSLAAKATVPSDLKSISEGLKTTKLPRGKVVFGMAKDYLDQVAKTSNATFYMDDGKVNVVKVNDLPDGTIFKLTPQSGLIGVPQQTELGVKGRSLLIPQIRINKSVMIDNRYIQERQLAIGTIQTLLDPNAVYRIAKTTYIGDTRGNDWYVEFEAMTQAGFVPAMLQNGSGNPF